VKRKKGFTLVELLAVIVILGIILAIAVPSITGLIANQRRNAFEANVKMIIKGIEYRRLEQIAVPVSDTENVVTTIGQYGGAQADYTTFRIRGLDPITIDLIASTDGRFAGYQALNGTFANPNVTALP
jgi:prepilin-type N-terminal cleavage/methylation domain-containing protein